MSLSYIDIDYFIKIEYARYAAGFPDNITACVIVRNEKIYEYCVNRFQVKEFVFGYYREDIESFIWVFGAEIIETYEDLKQKTLHFRQEKEAYSNNEEEYKEYECYAMYLLDDYEAEKIRLKQIDKEYK